MALTHVIALKGAVCRDGLGADYWDEQLAQARELQAYGEVTILLDTDSTGGDLHEGLLVHDRILDARAAGFRVVGRITGRAHSVATTLLCACDVVEALPSAEIMIHGCSGGDDADLRAGLDDLTAGVLAQKSARVWGENLATPKGRFLALLASGRDHYLDAEQAHSLGLVDSVIGVPG